jgi:hypothetical protein
MDWTGTSAQANKTVELAVIKVEATVPVTDPKYGGAVVLNPGGPGGSGIGQVLRGGHHVRTVLSAGSEAEGDEHKVRLHQTHNPGSHNTPALTALQYFDIIGFDPRGINNTRPWIGCHPDRLAAAAAAIEHYHLGYIGSSDISYDNRWASERAKAESCSQRAIDNVRPPALAQEDTDHQRTQFWFLNRASACMSAQLQSHETLLRSLSGMASGVRPRRSVSC